MHAVAQVLELNLNGKQYTTSNVQEWTDAICSQTVEALRGISGRFKYTGTYDVATVCMIQQAVVVHLCYSYFARTTEEAQRGFQV